MNKGNKRDDLIYPELSYKIVGGLFSVWSALGYGHKENFYQKAVAKEFKERDIIFKEQAPVKMVYKEELLGRYYFDFLIEDKIVLELKVRNYFSKNDIEQVNKYLRSANLKLGIIAHFTQTGVKFKRVVNII